MMLLLVQSLIFLLLVHFLVHTYFTWLILLIFFFVIFCVFQYATHLEALLEESRSLSSRDIHDSGVRTLCICLPQQVDLDKVVFWNSRHVNHLMESWCDVYWWTFDHFIYSFGWLVSTIFQLVGFCILQLNDILFGTQFSGGST